MRKQLFLLLALSLTYISAFAQIHLYPLATGELCESNNAAASVLETRMKSAISHAGMIASNAEGRFVLAAKVDILQKEVTQTAPQQTVLNLMVSYAIGDGYMGTSFASTSVEVKGIGPSEERAFMNALKALKANNPELIGICESAHDRILNYYEQNGATIIKKAKGLIASHQWDEACAELYAIPEECSHYPTACALMSEAVKSYSNYNSAQTVAEAEAMWSGNPSPENAEAVMALLANVDTDSPAYAKAQALQKKVEKRILNLEAQERADRLAAERREYNLRSQAISEEGKTRRAVANAAAQVASAYYRSHHVTYHVHSWW